MASLAISPKKWELSQDQRALVNWIFVWIFLANIPFMLMYFVGAPTRKYEIIIVGTVGILARRLPYYFQAIAFLTCLGGSVLTFIGGLFNLSFVSLVYSLQFFAELNPFGSAYYILMALFLVVISVSGLRALKSKTSFQATSQVIAAVAVIVSFSVFDYYHSKGNRGHYKREAPNGTVFESATSQSKFATGADGKKHLLLVVVESLGVPVDNPEMDKLVFAAYNQPDVKDRYEISSGTNLYFNSTTAGEIRELCGRWGDYHDLVDKKDDGCLPAKLASQGYDTKAVHSFKGWFFERKQWYPNIGFQQQQFWKGLEQKGIKWCGGVFAGACDHEIPDLLGKTLRDAEKPTFLYWLTVNTHLPVPSDMLKNGSDCSAYSKTLANDFPMICRQLRLSDAVDRGIVEQIMSDDFPDTDILVVGDHMPPYFDLKYRSQFHPERVPWIHLKRK